MFIIKVVKIIGCGKMRSAYFPYLKSIIRKCVELAQKVFDWE
jgi:hypothetical protein